MMFTDLHVPKIYTIFAFLSGGLLSLMILINGKLALHTDSSWSSLTAHFVGIPFSALLIGLWVQKEDTSRNESPPLWSFMGGLFGALTVILAATTFNSSLGVSGTIALSLLGQTLLSLIIDSKGWFGVAQRTIHRNDIFQLIFILVGSCILIFWAR